MSEPYFPPLRDPVCTCTVTGRAIPRAVVLSLTTGVEGFPVPPTAVRYGKGPTWERERVRFCEVHGHFYETGAVD